MTILSSWRYFGCRIGLWKLGPLAGVRQRTLDSPPRRSGSRILDTQAPLTIVVHGGSQIGFEEGWLWIRNGFLREEQENLEANLQAQHALVPIVERVDALWDEAVDAVSLSGTLSGDDVLFFTSLLWARTYKHVGITDFLRGHVSTDLAALRVICDVALRAVRIMSGEASAEAWLNGDKTFNYTLKWARESVKGNRIADRRALTIIEAHDLCSGYGAEPSVECLRL